MSEEPEHNEIGGYEYITTADGADVWRSASTDNTLILSNASGAVAVNARHIDIDGMIEANR